MAGTDLKAVVYPPSIPAVITYRRFRDLEVRCTFLLGPEPSNEGTTPVNFHCLIEDAVVAAPPSAILVDVRFHTGEFDQIVQSQVLAIAIVVHNRSQS